MGLIACLQRSGDDQPAAVHRRPDFGDERRRRDPSALQAQQSPRFGNRQGETA
jgi:hypothetical protein